MQLKITTDYAIRLTVFLAITGKITSTSEIANTMKIPKKYVQNITLLLRKANIVIGERGQDGGYRLARKPEEICLYDIMAAVEGTTKINRCLEEDHYCSRNAVDTCPVRKNYVLLQTIIDKKLKETTIASLLK